ncbi:hypothetical protein TNCV_548311 [Trichonephila clavipes]|nr:hypothetical protein TNCV_548311 [Trichonephila clavipes]
MECDCVRRSTTIAQPPNRYTKDGRKCTPHTMFNSEQLMVEIIVSAERKLIENEVVLYKDASRSEQRALVQFLIHLIPSATLRCFINSKASRRSCIIMPPKRRAVGRSTPQARTRRALRASE